MDTRRNRTFEHHPTWLGRALVGAALALAPAVANAEPREVALAFTPPSTLVTPKGALVPPSLAPVGLATPPASLVTAPPRAGVAPDKLAGDGERPIDYDTARYEPAGFPLLGGTSDIGVMGGFVATLTRFDGGTRPYRWNMDLVVAASAKSGPTGTEIVQQSYLWQIDVPGLMGGRVRVNPAAAYERTINMGYYGVGNATPVFAPNAPADLSRYNQFVAQEARVRQLTRIVIAKPFDLMLAPSFRYMQPETYPGSRLAQDAAAHGAGGAPIIRGLEPLGLASLGVGIVYDTRDNEFFPRRGAYHQVGVKAVQGIPADGDVRYGEASAILAAYVPVAHRTTFASRLFVDAEFGNVPFYDLGRGGAFLSYELFGGAQGVRGVPLGRYAGVLKAVGNVELRTMVVDFRVLAQSMHMGGSVFFDAGRSFSDYTLRAPADGTGAGIKYGVGAGMYLQWGQAAVFRVDVAYSPDAVAENPKLPLGIYVQDGVMF